MFLERMIQEIHPDKWEALEALDKKFNAVESRFGFPPKRRYQALLGSLHTNTLIIEREWNSLAEMEAAQMKMLADPEGQALAAETAGIIASLRWEVYSVLP